MTRRVRTLLLAAALAAAALAAVVLLTIRWALDPNTLRSAAESRLSAMLGQPVTIGEVRMSLLPVPVVTGSDVRVGLPDQGAPAVAVQQVRIVPRPRSILRRPISLEVVTLEGLAVSLLRDAEGRWHTPALLPAAGGGNAEGIIVERVQLRRARVRVFAESGADGIHETSSIDDIDGDVVTEGRALTIAPLRGRVGAAAVVGEAAIDAAAARLHVTAGAISDGDVSPMLGLINAERPGFLRLPAPASASLSMTIDRARSRLSGSGRIQAPQVAVEPLRLTQFDAPFTTDGLALVLEPATFALYGGTHRGTLTLDFGVRPARWQLTSQVTGLDAGDFLAALTARTQRVDGTAGLSATLRGRVGEPLDRTVEGRAHVVVDNGVVHGFPLLLAINRALRLAEGDARDTRFERLSATLAIASGHATTSDLVMLARDVRLEAGGRIGFDRSLSLAGHAILSPERTAAAIRSVHELAGLRNARGELELPVTISGSADAPAIQLNLAAMVERSLKEELRRRLRGIIKWR